MVTCALYARVSDREQLEGYSIDTQIEALRKYCKEKGYRIYDEYIEKGKSGTSMNRPELIRLVKDAENNSFNTILAIRIDRLFRNNLDRRRLEEKLKRKNISINYIHELDDPDTATGKLSRGIKGEFAEYFSNWLSENVSRGRRKRAEVGKCNSPAPYGYRLKDGVYEIVESEAEVVRKIFELYKTKGLQQVIEEMNGTRSPSGKKTWAKSTITKLISNPAYIGDTHYGSWDIKRVYEDDWLRKVKRNKRSPLFIMEDTHDAIIDRATFLEVQSIKHHRTYNGIKKPQTEFWLSGILYCAHCKKKMIAHRRKRKSSIERAYRCRNRECDGNYIGMDVIHEYVIDKIKGIIKDNEKDVKSAVKDFKPPQKIKLESDKIRNEIDNNLKNQDRLFNLYYKKEISKEQFRRQNDGLLEELNRLKPLLENTKEEIIQIPPEQILNRIKNVKVLIDKAEDKRDLFAQIFDKVLVYRSKEKFKRQPQRKVVIQIYRG